MAAFPSLVYATERVVACVTDRLGGPFERTEETTSRIFIHTTNLTVKNVVEECRKKIRYRQERHWVFPGSQSSREFARNLRLPCCWQFTKSLQTRNVFEKAQANLSTNTS